MRYCLAFVPIVLASFATLIAAQQPDVHTIIQHSVQANDVDWKANPKYDWTERDLQSDGGTKTFQEMMILGTPYGRLIEVNGKPVSASQQQEEQQKLDAEIAKRRKETPQERRKRIANFQRERRRDQLMMEELTKAFDFKVVGEQKLESYEVYVIDATPKLNYRPPNMQCQALKGMQGKLWIDKASNQWVKVEAEVVRPVAIEGFLAKVEPGTRFELEKTPVEKGVWLPKHFSMKSRAKVLYVFSRDGHDDETYWNYHRASGDAPPGAGQ